MRPWWTIHSLHSISEILPHWILVNVGPLTNWKGLWNLLRGFSTLLTTRSWSPPYSSEFLILYFSPRPRPSTWEGRPNLWFVYPYGYCVVSNWIQTWIFFLCLFVTTKTNRFVFSFCISNETVESTRQIVCALLNWHKSCWLTFLQREGNGKQQVFSHTIFLAL